ncbi:Type 1 glutamine amidotransferase-like domain-containing protein [Polyangium spumosum]|uniref:Peptidase n=1 Tax=Polyangium spumosum TaxID=889282 RepID=A0A6N7PTT3_9BACT|nr:Type 1 glutamine amidotransferase-like domain-containing protein [Polyangium spumosum]MRG94987.1 hypothetical protein [Polyangium spumosum]
MRGAILFNGNAESDEWLVRAAAPFLATSRHKDPAVAAARRTLLVTAGWAEHEYDEGHVKRALNAAGFPSAFEHGFDRAHENLSLLNELDGVLAEAPELAEAFRELRRAEATARRFYLEHNAHTIDLFRRTLREAKAEAPDTDLQSLLADMTHPTGPRALARHALARELRRAFHTLESNDDHLFELFGDIERRAFDAAGALYHPAFRAAKERLEARILSASNIFLFGGRLDLLLGALRFFRLRDVFVEALRRGAQIVAVSAGAMVLCERVIVYDDFAETPRDFQLYDRGLGIVQDLQVFPHCMERIQTDDIDNLAYLARRFRHHACVGLNQRSLLLLDLAPRRAVSVGVGDGVYVFGPDGRKRCRRAGEEVPIS